MKINTPPPPNSFIYFFFPKNKKEYKYPIIINIFNNLKLIISSLLRNQVLRTLHV